jgi:hypothetical protein
VTGNRHGIGLLISRVRGCWIGGSLIDIGLIDAGVDSPGQATVMIQGTPAGSASTRRVGGEPVIAGIPEAASVFCGTAAE